MATPSRAEATELARDDAEEAIGIARSGGAMQPIVGIADGAEHDAQTTGFHKRWWRQHDENWPADVREAYAETFTRELLAAQVAVVELQFDAAGGKWTNVGVVDLSRWEPTFPFDPESTGWIRQDPRSRVGWRRRSALRKLFSRKKDAKSSPPDRSDQA
ncbi:MAG TPA: hypothetical protein VN522_11610 [Solirubrobacterales bacterium]|nr:hypothetical protein [Solirubrobacterales bacterium]